MILYLHIGTEKTGSSYLQTMAAINREALLKERIWFPLGGRLEHQMIAGHISDGNAQPLTDAINENEWQKIFDWLKEGYKEGIQKNANKMLLSNELMLLALSSKTKIERFVKAIKQVGYSNVYFLVLLRDPVDHALSLYKHRAKSGRIKSIEQWATEGYSYGIGLRRFFDAADSISNQLNVRKYAPKQKPIENILFKDWLGVSDLLKAPKRKINPSLTLSELALLRCHYSVDKEGVKILYDQFLMLPKQDKANERELEGYHRSIIASKLSFYEETWEKCNEWLNTDEELIKPVSVEGPINQVKENYVYSSIQLRVINGYMSKWRSPSFQVLLKYRKYKRRLAKFVLGKILRKG